MLFILAALPALAGNAVLMTSLELRPTNIRYLEKKFRKAFEKSDLKIVIHHQVNPKTLHEIMTSPETEIALWISHAAGEHPTMPGMTSQNIILDFWGNDVKNFFTLIPENLKFLGMVGCQSKLIFDDFKARGNYELTPDLTIMSFDKKVRLYSAFKKTLKEAIKHINRPLPRIIKPQDTIEIEVTKDSSLTSSWVEIGDQVVAFLPAGETHGGSKIAKNLWDKIQKKNAHHLKILPEENDHEKIEITVDGLIRWKIFATKDGQPIGSKNKHLYIYK